MKKFSAEEVRKLKQKIDEGFVDADGTFISIPREDEICQMLEAYAKLLEDLPILKGTVEQELKNLSRETSRTISYLKEVMED